MLPWLGPVQGIERIFTDFPSGYRFLVDGGNPSNRNALSQQTPEPNLSMPLVQQSALLEHVPFGECYSMEATFPPYSRYSMIVLHRDRVMEHPHGKRLVSDDLSQGCWRLQKRSRCFYNERTIFVVVSDPYPKEAAVLAGLNRFLQLQVEAEINPAIALEPGEDVTRDYEFDGGNAEYARIGAGGFGSVYRVRHKSRANEPMRVVKVINKALYARSDQDVRHLVAELTITSNDFRADTTISEHISKRVALYHSPWRIFLVLELVNADKPPLDLSTRLYHLYATVKPRKIANVPALLQKRAMTEPATSDDAIVREALADVGVAEEIPATADILRTLQRRGTFPHRKSLLILELVLLALRTLHQYYIVHRDIKTENVILGETRRVETVVDNATGALLKVRVYEELSVRLIDFGLAKILDIPGTPTPGVGTDIYMALEMWKATLNRATTPWLSPQKELPKLDIYGAGTVLFTMCLGTVPFDVRRIPGYDRMTREQQREKLHERVAIGLSDDADWMNFPKAPERCPPGPMRDLIKKLMDNDMHRRPSATGALSAVRAMLDHGTLEARNPRKIPTLPVFAFEVDVATGVMTEISPTILIAALTEHRAEPPHPAPPAPPANVHVAADENDDEGGESALPDSTDDEEKDAMGDVLRSREDTEPDPPSTPATKGTAPCGAVEVSA